jgi:sulfur transfer complex TusBCD TusB component (DsrH family)
LLFLPQKEERNMPKYVFIESRDPYESGDCARFAEMVEGLQRRGDEATLYLVQNGVLGARRGAAANSLLAGMARNKVRILADSFSLRERGIRDMANDVTSSGMTYLVDLILEPGVKAVWH